MKPLRGVGVSPGTAAGVAVIIGASAGAVEEISSLGKSAERERLALALEATKHQLQEIAGRISRRAGEQAGGIFEAQAAMLSDALFSGRMAAAIEESPVTAEFAVMRTVEALAARFDAMTNETLRQRSADVRDLGNRVLRNLAGGEDSGTAHDRCVLIGRELSPGEIAGREPDSIAAVIAEEGGVNSHGAILCRSLNIPAVAGVAGVMRHIRAGETVLVNGSTGEVAVHDGIPLEQLSSPAVPVVAVGDAAPAVTVDGVRVEVMASLANPAQVDAAIAAGADGVGLLRTEFMFLARSGVLSEEDQRAAAERVLRQMAPRRVVVRIADLGGDKQAPWLGLLPESNPALGVRGIRLLATHRELFRQQLRALLRAASAGNLALMWPMVSDVDELRAARNLVDEVAGDLRVHPVPIGAMIETPAAALMAAELAAEADFFSIGTNDLAQYVLAVDRENAQLAGLYQPLHPAVLRLVAQVGRAATAAGKTLATCGEPASDPLTAPLWIGLGIRELSVGLAAIPAVKAAIRAFSVEAAERLAQHALTMRRTADVLAALREFRSCNRES